MPNLKRFIKTSKAKPNDLVLEQINVILVCKFGRPRVYKVTHKHYDYKVDKTGLQYTQKIGDKTYHIFGLQSGNTFLKISLDTDNLNWKLLEKQTYNNF